VGALPPGSLVGVSVGGVISVGSGASVVDAGAGGSPVVSDDLPSMVGPLHVASHRQKPNAKVPARKFVVRVSIRISPPSKVMSGRCCSGSDCSEDQSDDQHQEQEPK
jgi:hypothetical protein